MYMYMISIILLLIIAIIICINCINLIYNRAEKMTDIDKKIHVKPNMSDLPQDYMESHERLSKNQDIDECDAIDKYNNIFFGFRDRTNNSSNQNDPVNNINITNKGNDYLIGSNISDIYDDLVNSYDYKDTKKNVKKC